ncbi:hypothetical protein OROMI_024614 [Orobanche minor]
MSNMDTIDTIDISGDEGEEEIGSVPNKATIADKKTVASGSKNTTKATNAAKGKAQKKLKPNNGNIKKRQRKLTSPVWEYFKILDDTDENGNLVCLCNRCGVKYIAESSHGTGNMLRHGRTCKGNTYKDVGQFILKTGLNGSLGTRASTYKHDEFRELLAIAIAKHNLPLQFVEYEGIRNCFAYLHSGVKTVCRNTIKSDIKKMFSVEKTKLYDMLQSVPGKIALTSDCWTSVTTDGYISLTGHFVDPKWGLHKKILAFTIMPPPHTGAALAEKVYGLLKEWGIHNKVFSITLDNASNNDSMVDSLKFDLDLVCGGEYFQVRCCAHVVNLIVQDGLKELDGAVKKVRECVKYCKGSQKQERCIFTCQSTCRD